MLSISADTRAAVRAVNAWRQCRFAHLYPERNDTLPASERSYTRRQRRPNTVSKRHKCPVNQKPPNTHPTDEWDAFYTNAHLSGGRPEEVGRQPHAHHGPRTRDAGPRLQGHLAMGRKRKDSSRAIAT